MSFPNLLKNRLFWILIVTAAVILLVRYINLNKELEPVKVEGITMGNIAYKALYIDDQRRYFKNEMDSILEAFNQSLSTYIPSSEISRLNQTQALTFTSDFFLPVLQVSKTVYRQSNGSFDPTVGPLVNAWGFGPEEPILKLDSASVDSLLQFVGFNQVIFNDSSVSINEGMKLDFSAIAKGYAVDVLGDYLEQNDISNYLVEIGGEVKCSVTKNGKDWVVGIDDPSVQKNERRLFTTIELKDKATATSGNYRKYYVRGGKRYSHTIDPKTGYPVDHNLMSASVFAETCMEADAYATAFMVMGFDKSKLLIDEIKAIEAFLIYSDENGALKTYASPGIKEFLKVQQAN